MKKKTCFVALLVGVIASGLGYWRGYSVGVSAGRKTEEKETFAFRLYQYLQLYELRKLVESLQVPVPNTTVSLDNARLFVVSAFSYYDQHRESFEQSQRRTNRVGFTNNVERARLIVDEAKRVMMQQPDHMDTAHQGKL